MHIQQAKVKSVSSGNSLVLVSINNPAQERVLNLAFVSAPRLKKEGDEPYAFQSRDFLRRLVVGKVIQFQVLYTVTPAGSKTLEFGRVILSPTGPYLPELAVEQGWVKVRENAGSNENSEEVTAILEKLKALEAKARANGNGLWASSLEVVETAYDLADSEAFAERWKGQNLDAIVEKVFAGDRLVVRLILSSLKHQQRVVLIAGIKAPMTKRADVKTNKEQAAEEGGEEARTFVENRLLQRTVKVKVVGVTPQAQLVGVIEHPANGSIAPHVLKAGLARCLDFHSTMLGTDMTTLRQAERFAKQHGYGLFKSHVGQGNAAGANSSSDATVSRVQSADTLYIRNKAGIEKKVSLSSVRQPKPSDSTQGPYCAEAKEFLRKRLIGKHVTVQVDGKRPPQDGFEAREMATVTHSSKNVALLLVENGFVSVIRHRRDDDDRSAIYDELLAEEEAAQKDQKGMWAGKPPVAKTLTDASESLRTAKVHFSVLQRQRRVPAVVDYVKSGSRFTVIVPRENIKMTLVLFGIRAPRSARNATEKGEPFGQEAHDLAVRRCHQRDIEIDVESLDKMGGFIATLYVNRENFAKVLVEEGLATVHAYSAEQSGSATELFAAEQRAKESHKGMWRDWDPSQEKKEENSVEKAGSDKKTGGGIGGESSGRPTMTASPKLDYRDVVVTHIDPETCRLKLQQIGPNTTAALTKMMSEFRAFHLSASNDNQSLSAPPKTGEYVAAQFSEDGQWYRARVRHNDRDQEQAEVVYIDYGNSEKIAWSKLRPLPPSSSFSPISSSSSSTTGGLRPQAIDAVLSFVQFPVQKDYLLDATHFLQHITANGDRQLVARVHHIASGSSDGGATAAAAAATGVPSGTLYVTLFDPTVSEGGKDSLNAELIAEGLAMVPRKLKPWESNAPLGSSGSGEGGGSSGVTTATSSHGAADVGLLKILKDKEDAAKKDRKGIWEYGDLTDD